MLALGDADLAPARLAAAADGPVEVALSADAWARIGAARAVVERMAAGPEPVYGLNTGLGANLGHRLAPEEIPAFQAQLLLGRVVGVGAPLSERLCRMALLARLNGLARGVSGVSPPVVEALIRLAAAGAAPAVAGDGPIGAGDLAMGAEMGSTLLGHGRMWLGGRLVPAAEGLAAAELAPLVLGPKDAIVLVNTNAFTVALAVEALAAARSALERAMGVAALAGEGFAMNPGVFSAPLNALRAAAGQEAAAAWFRRALAGSALLGPGGPRSIQDALSFRTMAPVFGAALAALAAAERETAVELNAGADSPAVLVGEATMRSTANFLTPALALALDALAVALAQVAGASAQRTLKLMNPALTGLPRYLSPVGGASAGLVALQKTAAALLAEIRQGAHPACLDAIAVSESVEDVAPQTPLTARKLAAQTRPFARLTAIEALTAAQALDLRAPGAVGPVAARLQAAIRAAVPMLDADRPLGPEIERVAQALASPEIEAFLAAR